jgi:hypothetical protein
MEDCPITPQTEFLKLGLNTRENLTILNLKYNFSLKFENVLACSWPCFIDDTENKIKHSTFYTNWLFVPIV